MSVEISSLKMFTDNREEAVRHVVRHERVLKALDHNKEMTAVREEGKRRYLEELLHGQFFTGTEEIRTQQAWRWLSKGQPKKETESLRLGS